MNSSATNSKYLLIGDIGGTHARFAVSNTNCELEYVACYVHAPFETIESLIQHYLTQPKIQNFIIKQAAIAVAAPIHRNQDLIRMTNTNWQFSKKKLQQYFSWSQLTILNDFTALALSIPYLTNADLVALVKPITNSTLAIDNRAASFNKQSTIALHSTIALIGPGTGLGISGMVHQQQHWQALTTEGGHVALAAITKEENELLFFLQQKYHTTCAELLLCGPGLERLFKYFAPNSADPLSAIEISTASLNPQQHPLGEYAKQATDYFFNFLATTARNLVLILGAHGGLYLGGGMLPKMQTLLEQSNFLNRFQQQFATPTPADYLTELPVFLITHPTAALVGLAQNISSFENNR